jgi:hypothetical protein
MMLQALLSEKPLPSVTFHQNLLSAAYLLKKAQLSGWLLPL